MRPPRYRPLIAAALGLSALDAQAASLSDLFDRVPAPPADVGTALGWIDHGQIVTPEYTQLKQAIEAERASIIALNGGALPAEFTATAPASTEPPEVQGALRGYGDYLANNSGKQNPASVLGKRARWLHAAMAGKLGSLLGRMKPCALPCTDAAANAQNQPLLGARNELAEQDLRQWNTLFVDWHDKRSNVVANAQALIAATAAGDRAGTPAARSAIAQYRAAILKEVETSLSVTELALRRAYAIETGDVDAVSASTYSPKGAKKS